MFKKITASVLALLMVFGAGVNAAMNYTETTIGVSAENESNRIALGDGLPDGIFCYESGDTAYFDLVAMGYDPTSVSHCTITFDVNESEDIAGFGGVIIWNDFEYGWQMDEQNYCFTNLDDYECDNPIKPVFKDGSYYIDFDVPANVFSEYDASNEEYYAWIVMQPWWGGELTITGVEITGDPLPEIEPDVPDEPDDSTMQYNDFKYVELDDGTIEIRKYIGKGSEVEIPTNINGKSVTSIGDGAFRDCQNLVNVTIPDGVTNIGYAAFWFCNNLENIVIPESVVEFGHFAFNGTPWLDSKRKENPLIIINNIVIDGKTCVGKVDIPDGVTKIIEDAFSWGENITEITMSDSVTSIGESAFECCRNLKSISLSKNITEIEPATFYHCERLESIIIPDSVTTIGKSAFAACISLASLIIPNSVTSIGDTVFHDCYNLTSITLPDGIPSIGYYAFNGCESLTDITIPNSVTSIGESAFWYCTSLTSIVIPDNVNSIGYYAFEGCTSLTNVTLPDNDICLLLNVFYDCTSLKSVIIPANISMGDYIFGYYYDIDSAQSLKIEGFKIYCYPNTDAERYAIENEFDYELLEPDDTPDLSGSIKFAGDSDEMKERMTVDVTDEDGNEYNIEVNEDGTFSISHISNGDYTLTVSADGYVPRDEKITIDGNPFELALTLCKPGDIDGSGKVDITDVTTAIASVRGVRKLDTYATKVGNVAGTDDKLDITDVTRLISHVRGVRPL